MSSEDVPNPTLEAHYAVDGADDDLEDGELARLRAQATAHEGQIANLQVALQSARTIGMALGIIMSRGKVTPEQAFTLLSARSQRVNRKVRDLAEAIVLTGEY